MVLSSFSKRTTFAMMNIHYLLVSHLQWSALDFKPHDLSNSMHFIVNILWITQWMRTEIFFKIQINLFLCQKTWELPEDKCYKHKTSRCFEDVSRDLGIQVFKRFLKYWTVKNDLGHREVGKRSLWRMLRTVEKKHPTAWFVTWTNGFNTHDILHMQKDKSDVKQDF